VKHRIALCSISSLLFGFLFAATNATAQTIGYRQTNLASDLPNVANSVTPRLVNPWGIAFLPDQPFFIADNQTGMVTAHNATGSSAEPDSFAVPNAARTGFDTPSGIVADQNSFFGSPSLVQPFLVVTDQGTVLTWGPDARGDLPQEATLAVDNGATGAVYKGAAILDSSATQPALAATDFHGGFIETFLPGFVPVALSGSFTDPDLPSGYAPFGIQVIGKETFVTYAVQDAAKREPVTGQGNGIVSIFDLEGHFVRRFATGGTLNAPWGIAQASANFGPFSNDILIGNSGDGTINAFDPATGRFLGKLKDGDDHDISEVGLHALIFRADGFGDPNTLYFTSELSNERDGLFGAISTGMVTTTKVSVPSTPTGAVVTIEVAVSAGPLDRGTPTGPVVIEDGGVALSSPVLTNGVATFETSFTAVGSHVIKARYEGDALFLPSSSETTLEVSGLATVLTLMAPAVAAPGSTVTLTASINSAGGIPTGQIVFHDGNTVLGSSPLNDAGVAILRTDTLAVGAHTLTASYAGDEKFGASVSAGVNIDIANADFSVSASPVSATVKAGQSTQFILTATPAGGFANAVTFSCSPITGITCSFNPATVTPGNGAATTTFTVTTSASVSRFGFLLPDLLDRLILLVALALFSFAMQYDRRLRSPRASFLTPTAVAAMVALGLVIGGCGAGGSNTQPNRGTASIRVTAQSGTISHVTTVLVTVE
jgi:uncharacterized protein (TIGR03118 family)